jgi:hypothetical protein
MSATAIVARTRANGLEYLHLQGASIAWSSQMHIAARFPNVREATRAAMRLPSRLRAYALPVCEGLTA